MILPFSQPFHAQSVTAAVSAIAHQSIVLEKTILRKFNQYQPSRLLVMAIKSDLPLAMSIATDKYAENWGETGAQHLVGLALSI